MKNESMAWRELEQQLAEPSSFERLLEREEEIESKTFNPTLTRPYPFPQSNAQTRWLQRALNRVLKFRIPENGVLSGQTRKALQKFQAAQGLPTTGRLGPKTRAALSRAGGISMPRTRTAVEHPLDEPFAEGEMEAASNGTGMCPADTPYSIRGFNQYSDDIHLLPPSQQTRLDAIATEIAHSHSGASGVTPVTQVVVVGYADADLAREQREPGFLQFMSEKRAQAVFEDLFCKVTLKSQPRVADVRWMAVGRGAKNLVVSSPRNEAARKCNRRAEIILSRALQPSPRLDEHQRLGVAADHRTFRDFYHATLQGTTGQYDSPQLAEKKAREIADAVLPFLEQRSLKKRTLTPGCDEMDDFLPYFKDAIQGTASKYKDSAVVIQKAAEAAETTSLGLLQETRKLQWRNASLPQPIGPDCEIVRGKVPGPANYALCGTHDHILDTNTKTVIAHNLDEYKKQFHR